MNVGFSVKTSSKDRYYCERFSWKSIVLNKKQLQAYRARQLYYLQKQEKKKLQRLRIRTKYKIR